MAKKKTSAEVEPVEEREPDIFDELLKDEESAPEAEKKPKATKTRGKRAEIMKDNLADIEAKHAENIKRQKEEVAKEEAEAKKKREQNVVIIDLLNTDDRVKLQDLEAQGKILADRAEEPFLVALQVKPPYNPSNPVAHKIYTNDITSITIRAYYTDLTLVEAGMREKVREDIWVAHKGYTTMDMITVDQLRHLIDNNLFNTKHLYYSHTCLTIGESFFMGNSPVEPTLVQIEQAMKERGKIYNAKKFGDSKADIEDSLPETASSSIEEPLAEIPAEEMKPIENLEPAETNEGQAEA